MIFKWVEFVKLESGNNLVSYVTQMLQMSQILNVNSILFLSITDLNYLNETISNLAMILLKECSLVKKIFKDVYEKDMLNYSNNTKSKPKFYAYIRKMCNNYVNKNGHLHKGVTIYGWINYWSLLEVYFEN